MSTRVVGTNCRVCGATMLCAPGDDRTCTTCTLTNE